MSDVFWNMCSTIMVDLIEDDIDLNNLLQALDNQSADKVISHWSKYKLNLEVHKAAVNKLYINTIRVRLNLPRSYEDSWGHKTTDHGSVDVKYLKIKQKLSDVDTIHYCKSYLFSSLLSRGGCQKVGNIQYDPDRKLDIVPKHGTSTGDGVCSSMCEWKVVLNGNARNINIQQIALSIKKCVARWRGGKEEVFEQNTNAIGQRLANILLPNLMPPWKYLLVSGKNESQKPGKIADFTDIYGAEAIHLWYFFDKKQSDEYFTQAMLLRVVRRYSEEGW